MSAEPAVWPEPAVFGLAPDGGHLAICGPRSSVRSDCPLTPWVNHSWQGAAVCHRARPGQHLPFPSAPRFVEIEFDFIGHRLARSHQRGDERTLALEPQAGLRISIHV